MNRAEDAGKYWLESTLTGERGFLVDATNQESPKPIMPPAGDGAKIMVQLDRPREVRLKRFSEDGWRPVHTPHPLSEVAKADIAHHALRRLAFFLGDHKASRKELISMREGDRISFVRGGPAALDSTASMDIRQGLWNAIQDVLNGKGHKPGKK